MKKNSLTLWLLTPIVLFAIVGAFAKIMISLDHNEHMYIAASVLVSQNHILYKDFAYLQTPYLPLLYGNLYDLLNISSYYLLIGKLISFLFLCISALTLFLVARRLLNDIALALSFVALFLLNMTIVNSASEVSNYIMPMAFSILGFYMFDISINNEKIPPLGIALAGLFVAVAVGTKLTYTLIIIPFVVITLLYPMLSKQSVITVKQSVFYVFIPFAAGISIGLLPILFYLLSDPVSFIFNNSGYHNVNTQWRQMTGFTGPMSLFSKMRYAHSIFFRAENLIIILGILFGFALSINSFQAIKQTIRQLPIGALLACLLFFIAVPTALAPTPSWPQYYAIPVSFLFLLLVYSCASNSLEMLKVKTRLLFILVLLSLVYSGPIMIRSISHLASRDGWVGLHVHDVSMNIRNVLISNGMDTNRKIATLSPLFAIECNWPIYGELSTGPFLYRVGDLLTSEQRNHFVGTSPESIGDLLSEDPPAAILVGFEGSLDKPLVEYARIGNYKKVDVAGFDGDLYVRP